MFLKKLLIANAIALMVCVSPAIANDARAVSLGGLALTHGQGVHGVLANPATLMHLQRRGQGVHLRFGASADLRDPGKFIESAIDNRNLAADITNSINQLDSAVIGFECGQAVLGNDPNVACLNNTGGLGADFQRVIEIMRTLSQQPMEVLAGVQGGFGYSKSRIPMTVHFNYSLAGAGVIGFSQNDLAYLSVLENALIDGTLTSGDIINSVVSGTQIIAINPNVDNILIARPQDVLTSQFGGTRLDRRQVGISLAHTFEVAGRDVDVGITPKVSSITTYRAAGTVASEFDLSTPSIADDFINSETNTVTFTLDVGATYSVNEKLAVSGVIRNLFPEIAPSSFDNFTIKTTPQMMVGAAYQFTRIKVNLDAALNAAEQDGVITHPFALGAEYGQGNYSLRTGISVDNGRTADKAALTLGFGLGPLQFGARVSSLNAIQAGAQLSYSFR